MELYDLTDEQAGYAMEKKEFDPTVLNKSQKVAVVLTQAWCPQWIFMKGYLKRLNRHPEEATRDVSVFTLEYDKASFFSQFMKFKETVFNNHLVPYVRYYQYGKLIDSSNFVSKVGFLSHFE